MTLNDVKQTPIITKTLSHLVDDFTYAKYAVIL